MNKLPEEAAFSPQGVVSGFEEVAMNKDDVAGLVELKKLQKDAGIPHLPTQLTYHLRRAVAGYGTLAYQWADKPHRLVYDACREIEAQADALTTLSTENERLSEENFALSASACIVPNGLIGDEHGHQHCTLSARVETLEAALHHIRQSSDDIVQHHTDRDMSETEGLVIKVFAQMRNMADKALAGDDHG